MSWESNAAANAMDTLGKHFLLVHGACHGAWSWYKVVAQLRSDGHKVAAIDLAAAGAHPKRADEIGSMSEYMEPLMEFMHSLKAEDRVVLVGHSAGGFSVSAAMERFPKKISVAVFVAAMMPHPDQNILTLAQKFDLQLDSQMDNKFRFDKGHDKPPTAIVFGPKFLSSKLYNLSPPEDLTLAELLVRPYPLYADVEKSVDGTGLTKANYGTVYRVYIVLRDDCTTKEKLQGWMIENNPPNEVKVISGSDHMVMCSKPQQLCSCLQDIANKYH